MQGEVNHLWAKYRKVLCKWYYFLHRASICYVGRICVTWSNICSYLLFQEDDWMMCEQCWSLVWYCICIITVAVIWREIYIYFWCLLPQRAQVLWSLVQFSIIVLIQTYMIFPKNQGWMSKLSLSHFTFFEVFKCVSIMPEGNNNFIYYL